jgi:ribosome-binding ATPase YchF (GTP1/OBG family)
VVVCAKMEAEFIPLTDEEKHEYQEAIFWEFTDYASVPTLDRVIKTAFDEVGLMYYFTAWEKECRAWTIPKGSTAPQAAGVIHTDFEKWFIRAEVVWYDNLIQDGSRANARSAWHLKQEGKEYVVQDGDVMLFRFNV